MRRRDLEGPIHRVIVAYLRQVLPSGCLAHHCRNDPRFGVLILTPEQKAILENCDRIIALEHRMDALEHSSDRRVKILTKVMGRVKIDEETGCWLWQGPTSGSGRGGGYGRMCLGGQTVAVHRVMATLFMGYIPGKKQVDHTCRNRLCVNPDHLEIVTHKENQRRRDAERNEVMERVK